MNLRSQMIIASGGAFLLVAIFVPLAIKKSRPVAPPSRPPNEEFIRGSAAYHSERKPERSQTSTRRGWATTLAPIYTTALFSYVVYVVYKIVSGKKQDRNNSTDESSEQLKRGKKDAEVSKEELIKMEEKLLASEKAIEDMLEKARTVISDVYQQELEESSLSDSSDDDGGRIEGIDSCTTSSANNDRHQDSSSSTDDEELMTLHHKTHHYRSQKSLDSDDSTSSEAAESGIHPRSPFGLLSADNQMSKNSLADEYISTNHEQSDFDDEELSSNHGDASPPENNIVKPHSETIDNDGSHGDSIENNQSHTQERDVETISCLEHTPVSELVGDAVDDVIAEISDKT